MEANNNIIIIHILSRTATQPRCDPVEIFYLSYRRASIDRYVCTRFNS